MNKCPSCKLENVLFIDSSEHIRIETDIQINEFEKWEEYECQDCGASLLLENGYITVRRFDFTSFQYKILMKYSVDWEKKLEKVYSNE